MTNDTAAVPAPDGRWSWNWATLRPSPLSYTTGTWIPAILGDASTDTIVPKSVLTVIRSPAVNAPGVPSNTVNVSTVTPSA